MKVAIAADGKVCSDHFGHCSGFQIYEIENNKIIEIGRASCRERV